MTIQRMIELLDAEHRCMLRNTHGDCNRQCEDCDFVRDDGELHEMYTDAVYILQEHLQKEHERKTARVITRVGSGTTWWCVCSACGASVSRGDRYCRQCGAIFQPED